MAIGQPDLVAQKILNSGPEGFADGAVLPYRHEEDPLAHTLDRIDLLKRQHAKENADHLTTQLNRLPEINRRLQERQLAQKQDLTQHGISLHNQGVNAVTDPQFMQHFNQVDADIRSSNQHEADYKQKMTEINSAGDFVNKPVLQKKLTNEYEEAVAKAAINGDYSGIQGGFKTTTTDPEAFETNQYIAKTVKDFGDTVTSNEDLRNGAYGQLIYKDEKGYKFKTDKDGKIDQGVKDYFLRNPTADPNMLQHRAVVDNLTDKKAENLALMYQQDPAYKDLSVGEIKDRMARPGTPIYFDREKYKDDILDADLKPYQKTTDKHDIGAGHAYPKPEKGDAEKSNVVVKPAVITSNMAVTRYRINENGTKTPIKQVGSLPIASPGFSITLKNGKSPVVDVSPDHYWDGTNGTLVNKNKDAFDMEVTGGGLTMTRPDGKLLSTQSPRETIDVINKLPLKDLVKHQLVRFAIGNVVDKASTTGDSDNATTGSIPKKQATLHNKRIYIPMEDGHLDTQKINSATGDQATTTTPEMQKVQDAYDNRFKNATDAELVDLINDQFPNDTREQKKQTFFKMKQQ